MRDARPASMADVARLAGVSAQTVSRVARGESSVAPATARRVREAMRTVDYRPNPAARALRNGNFGTIGIVGHRLARTGEAHIIEAVVGALREEGYSVMLVDVPSNDAEVLNEAIGSLSQAVDGLVVLRLETPTPSKVRLPDAMPVVLSDSRVSAAHPTVGTDHVGGVHDAVTHLLDLGHETVHHVAGPPSSIQAQLREKGWREALARAGREVPPPLRGDWSPASGHRAGLQLLTDPLATAVVCANDEMALGLLRACDERGVRVPSDLSVVGFDDIESAWFTPPLTTIAQDFVANGRLLVAALMEQLRDGRPGARASVLVPSRLMVRQSTSQAPCRADGARQL